MAFIQRAGCPEVPVPLDDDNSLAVCVLERYFPSAAGIYYEKDGQKIPVKFNDSMTKLMKPDCGWNDKIFVVVETSCLNSSTGALTFPARKSLNVSSSTQITTPSDYSLSEEKLKKVREWIYVCYQGGVHKNVEVCVNVISNRYAASASHCFPTAVYGDEFQIINIDAAEKDEKQDYLNVKVEYIERLDKNDRGAGIIVFGSFHGDKLFNSAPTIVQLPDIGTRYLAIGKGPHRPGDYDRITITHGMIASNLIDSHHILGDNGNNPGYSGGLVLSRKGPHLLGLITARSTEIQSLEKDLNIRDKEFIKVVVKGTQPRSYILPNTYLHYIVGRLESREIERQRINLIAEKQRKECNTD